MQQIQPTHEEAWRRPDGTVVCWRPVQVVRRENGRVYYDDGRGEAWMTDEDAATELRPVR